MWQAAPADRSDGPTRAEMRPQARGSPERSPDRRTSPDRRSRGKQSPRREVRGDPRDMRGDPREMRGDPRDMRGDPRDMRGDPRESREMSSNPRDTERSMRGGYRVDPRDIRDPREMQEPRDPRNIDPRMQDPRMQDPRNVDPRTIDPRTIDPRNMDPRNMDPRNVDPRNIDPRNIDPRMVDPRMMDPRMMDPRMLDPRNGPEEEGPTPICRCRVLYLGSLVPHVTKDGLQGIQEPLKELYPEDGALGAKGIDSWLSVWSNGFLLENVDENRKKVSRFFPIDSLHYCAAVRYVQVPGTSGEKVRGTVMSGHVVYALRSQVQRFLPLDSPFARNPNINHPPLFAAILRRTTGIKVLECHVFICKRETAANALVR